MPGQGDKIDVDLLQIEGLADQLFNGFAADHEPARGVDLDQTGRVTRLRGGVVGQDRVDDGAHIFVVLKGNEYVGHAVSPVLS